MYYAEKAFGDIVTDNVFIITNGGREQYLPLLEAAGTGEGI